MDSKIAAAVLVDILIKRVLYGSLLAQTRKLSTFLLCRCLKEHLQLQLEDLEPSLFPPVQLGRVKLSYIAEEVTSASSSIYFIHFAPTD